MSLQVEKQDIHDVFYMLEMISLVFSNLCAQL